ncbi:MAG: SPOR domain-containing protein [Pseudomonadota bacterium]
MIKTQRGGTLIGIILGVVVGVLLSFGVVWYLNKTPLPFVEKVTKPEQTNGNGAKAPVALPGKPGDKPIDKGGEKKFEFYDILEGKKQATPGTTPAPTTAAPAAPAAAGNAYLQVGAFQKKADADNLKGRLAMLGFEAGVVPGEVAGKGTMHRVRVGPFANTEEMNRARSQLSQQGVPATVVRAKD